MRTITKAGWVQIHLPRRPYSIARLVRSINVAETSFFPLLQSRSLAGKAWSDNSAVLFSRLDSDTFALPSSFLTFCRFIRQFATCLRFLIRICFSIASFEAGGFQTKIMSVAVFFALSLANAPGARFSLPQEAGYAMDRSDCRIASPPLVRLLPKESCRGP